MAILVEYADVVMDSSQRDEEFFIRVPLAFESDQWDNDGESFASAISFFDEHKICHRRLTGFYYPGSMEGLRYIWADIDAGSVLEKMYSQKFEDDSGKSLPNYNFQAVYFSKSGWEANHKEIWDNYKINGDPTFD